MIGFIVNYNMTDITQEPKNIHNIKMDSVNTKIELFSNDSAEIFIKSCTFGDKIINEVNVKFKQHHTDNTDWVNFLHMYAQVLRVQDNIFTLNLNTIDIAIDSTLLQYIKSFAKVNAELFDIVGDRLLCSTIKIINNSVKQFINSTLQLFYKPRRPLIFYVEDIESSKFKVKCVVNIKEILGNSEIEYDCKYT
tara:strand:- start:2950 stop:3528 length:579 start_codon:yes stop_codon:yes gene_type:complete